MKTTLLIGILLCIIGIVTSSFLLEGTVKYILIACLLLGGLSLLITLKNKSR